jgi:hypothetical protein
MVKLVAAVAVAVSAAPTAGAVPVYGGNGLCPNAWALVQYIQSAYPAVQSIGGVRDDPLPDHPSGHAVDIMVGGNTALGNRIFADVMSQRSRFGVRYGLWQVPAHYDHIHITVV